MAPRNLSFIENLRPGSRASLPPATAAPEQLPGSYQDSPSRTNPISSHHTERQASEESVLHHLDAQPENALAERLESLKLIYYEGDDSHIALAHTTQFYARQEHLSPTDVEDLGVKIGQDLSTYRLSRDFAQALWSFVDDLQSYLSALGDLAGRDSIYALDPYGRLRQLLTSTNSLSYLDAAWKMLHARIVHSQKIVVKYEAALQGQPLHSPATTNREILSPLESDPLNGSRLLDIMSSVPYLTDSLSERQRRRIAKGREFKDVWLEPEKLTQAFPSRRPEERPKIISYLPNGVPFTRTPSLSTVSSLESQAPEASLPQNLAEEVAEHVLSEDPPSERPPTPRYTITPSRTSNMRFSAPTLPVITSPPQESASAPITNVLYGAASMRFGQSRLVSPVPKSIREPPNPSVTVRRPLSMQSLTNPSLELEHETPIVGRTIASSRAVRWETSANAIARENRAMESHGRLQAPVPLLHHQRDRPPHMSRNETISTQGNVQQSWTGGRSDRGNTVAISSASGRIGGRQPHAVNVQIAGAPGPPSPGGSDDPDDPGDRRPPPWNIPRPRQPVPPGRPQPQPNPPFAYGRAIPTIKSELKPNDIPTWDGNPSTAVKYFAQLQELASLGGDMPQALAFWAGGRFTPDSAVADWYLALDPACKEAMKANYLTFIETIRTYFLGDAWAMQVSQEFLQQAFRQKGHLKESPVEFLTRRVILSRMLGYATPGSKDEVALVLKNAPIPWRSVIAVDSIRDTATLHLKLTEHREALIQSATQESKQFATVEELQAVKNTLLRLGARNTLQRRAYYPSQHTEGNVTKIGGATEKTEEELEEPVLETTDNTVFSASSRDEIVSSPQDPHDAILNEAFVTLQQSFPAKQGTDKHPFTRQDQVVTSLAKKPNWPCRPCGSLNHWDKECPHFQLYLQWRKRTNKSGALATERPHEIEGMYNTAYSALLMQSVAQLYDETSTPIQNHSSRESLPRTRMESRKGSSFHSHSSPDYKTRVEEIEDEHWKDDRHKDNPLGGGILEDKTANEAGIDKSNLDPEPVLPSAPPDVPAIKLNPRRSRPGGLSSLGVSVVATQGSLGTRENGQIDLRFDSGADVSLVSEETYQRLKNPPRLRQGVKMKLYQLTDANTKLKGYIRLPVFMTTQANETIETTVEAYVVPNMTVPILLGEDYHQAYELTISRNLEKGTSVQFGTTRHVVSAQGVKRPPDSSRLRPSAYQIASFVRAKLHRINKRKRRDKKRKQEMESRTIKVARDTRILPGYTSNVPAEGPLQEAEEWVLERSLLAAAEDGFFAVPNVLISRDNPVIPIANLSSKARILRKGETIGIVAEPSKFFDRPASLHDLQEKQKQAVKTSTIVRALYESQAEKNREPEQWGPKTAEIPEDETYPSEELEKLIDVGTLPEHLKEEAWTMLRRRVKAFGFDNRLGSYPARVHVRTNEDQQPIAVPMYGTSPEKRQIIEKQLEVWFEQGVIEPSISPWSAPVVIAYRNNKPRLCVDYRKLNAVTIRDEFPIPRQSEILASLSGAQVLSSLDALAGFTQLEMAPEDAEKTAFRTHKGLFQFKRMPFGLTNGPPTFQRIMQAVLAPYLWLFCLVYIDDIVVYSSSYEEHIHHLDKVLEAIENAGLTLSPTKCHLFYPSITLLGHKVSRLGLATHDEKVKTVLELSRPNKISQLQTFLGMLVYFSSFIPHYATICAPLFQLLRKGAKWTWTDEHEKAFEEGKRALASAPVLAHPERGQPYRLYTDASDEALGCALQQVQRIQVKDLKGTKAYDKLKTEFEAAKPPPQLVRRLSDKYYVPGNQEWDTTLEESWIEVERVIAYWSRTFKDAERRYSTTEREALAAKEGLVKFQPFIEGERVTLITDHSALQWAKTYDNANRRLASWSTIFSAYAPNLEIIHRPGRSHSNVDPLSRLPRPPPEHTSPTPKYEPSLTFTSVIDEEHPFRSKPAKSAVYATRSKAKQEKSEDKLTPMEKPPSEDELTDEYAAGLSTPPTIHFAIDPAELETWTKAYGDDPAFRNRYAEASQEDGNWTASRRFYKDTNGILFFRDADFRPKVCVPKAKQVELIRQVHEHPFETAHAGPEKLWHHLSSRYYWPRMGKDISRFTQSCDICQKTKSRNFGRYGSLIPNPIPTRPYESISMDFIVNLPTSGPFNAIWVVVDRLTKHAQFIPITTGLTASDFAELFVRSIACRFGLPDSIISDRDARWTSEFWKATSSALRIRLSMSSSHHPQHDGQTEITNRTLETMLRAYTAQSKASWSSWIHMLEFTYNSLIHSSTGYSPFKLLYGFEPKRASEFVGSAKTDTLRAREPEKFLQEFTRQRDYARQAIARAQDRQATAYNKGRRPCTLGIGDFVLINPHELEWVESKGEGSKLVQRWIGPFEITEKINPQTYRVRLDDRYNGSPVFNIAHLRRYIQSPTEFGTRTTLPDTRTSTPTEEYEVEKIIEHRPNKNRRGYQYLIRWKHHSPAHDSWQTERDLRNAPELLRDYKRRAQL